MRGTVPLNRALSKLGALSRARATAAIRAGRVSVDGRVVTEAAHAVVPERARLTVDGVPVGRRRWRTIAFHKPRGTVTTRRDPGGRRTVWDVVGEVGDGLVSVGRLDLATTGLLIMTSDTRLADWLADPVNAVPRLYMVTVRGRMAPEDALALVTGPDGEGGGEGGEGRRGGTGRKGRKGRKGGKGSAEGPGKTATGDDNVPRAAAATLLKASGRESHLIIELREGRNRAVRRMCEAAGHDVTRLKRVRFGELELGDLPPGGWREVSAAEVRAAFPGAPVQVKGRAV